MLSELFIKNFVLIKESLIKLEKGLITVTGESGSGKSLFLSSIYYLFGGKLKNNIIMSGENECILLGKFKANKEVKEYLSEKGIFIEDFIIIKRIISLKSEDTFLNSYYINNEPISHTLLRPVFDMLIEIHSQNQQYLVLKNPANNLKILDNYAGLNDEVTEYKKIYEEYVEELNEYDKFVLEINNLNLNLEEYERVVAEINKMSPKLEEEELLKNRINEIKNFESLSKALLNLKNVLTFGENFSALSEIKKVISDAEYLSNLDDKYRELEDRLQSTYYEIEDIGATYEQYLFEVSYDEAEVENVEKRLYDLSKLKKKYGSNLQEVIELKEKYEMLIDNSIDFSNELSIKEQILIEKIKKIKEIAYNVSEKRKKSAIEFGSQITEILQKLNMKNAEFLVRMSGSEISKTGVDEAEFLISSNLGLKAGPVHKVASGGELSRIMLAIKSVENLNEDKLVIFDEIDSGIGGEAGVRLAKYLKILSENIQIFVITHLANVASIADFHILIEKEDILGKTFTRAFLIKNNERILEIARMLSGEVNEISTRHAKELLNLYE